MAVKLGNGQWAVKENNLLAYNDNSGQFFNKEFDFTRGSSATYVGKDGLIKTAGLQDTNLVQNGDFSELGSEEVTNGNFDTDSDWGGIGSNGFSISGGKLNLSDVAYAQNASQGNVTTVGKTYKVTFEISDYVKGAVRIFLGGDVTPTQTSNGVFTSYVTATANANVGIQTISGDGTTLSIDNVSVKQVDPNDEWTLGSGWSYGDGVANYNDNANNQIAQNVNLNAGIYKLKFSISNTTGNGGRIWIGNDGGSVDYTNNSYQYYINGDYIININVPSNQTSLAFWGNTGGNSFSISNISVQEIQVNTPRIDFSDSADGALLLEPQSTNTVTYSEDFNLLVKKNNVVVTSNATLSPSGSLNADEITFDGTAYGRVEAVVSATVGQTYTISLYLKNKDLSDKTQVWIGFSQSSQGGYVTITDEWQRYDITTTADGTSEYPRIQFGGTGSLYAWGFQTEQQSYATSYIPTQGSASTRIAETCNNSGSAQDFNSEEGVLYAEISGLVNGGSGDRTISISDGSTQNAIQLLLHNTANRINFRLRSGGSLDVNISDFTFEQNQTNKIACKYKLGDYALWINGEEKATSSSSSLPSGLSVLAFDDGSLNDLYGKVKNIQVFTTALSDEELQKLTTI